MKSILIFAFILVSFPFWGNAQERRLVKASLHYLGDRIYNFSYGNDGSLVKITGNRNATFNYNENSIAMSDTTVEDGSTVVTDIISELQGGRVVSETAIEKYDGETTSKSLRRFSYDSNNRLKFVYFGNETSPTYILDWDEKGNISSIKYSNYHSKIVYSYYEEDNNKYLDLLDNEPYNYIFDGSEGSPSAQLLLNAYGLRCNNLLKSVTLIDTDADTIEYIDTYKYEKDNEGYIRKQNFEASDDDDISKVGIKLTVNLDWEVGEGESSLNIFPFDFSLNITPFDYEEFDECYESRAYFNIKGQNLKDGTYKINSSILPEGCGTIKFYPDTFVVRNGAINEKVRLLWVYSSKTNMSDTIKTLVSGIIGGKNISINLLLNARVEKKNLINISDSVTWDFSKVKANNFSGLPYVHNYYLLADVSGINNNKDFQSQSIMVKSDFLADRYIVAQGIRFRTNKPGYLSVKYSKWSADTCYLKINGKQYGEICDGHKVISADSIFVPAGDVYVESNGELCFHEITWIPTDGSTGIRNTTSDKIRKSMLYNLSGQIVNEDYHGIVIKNGKKYYNK